MAKNRAFDHSKYQNWIDPRIVKEYPHNAKEHNDRQIKNICTSIRRFGWQQDTVITADNVLVIGHGRRLAAIELGCEMPYHRIDKAADELTDKDIRELRIADNQTNAETGFDFEIQNIEIADLDFSGFDFDQDEKNKEGLKDAEIRTVEIRPYNKVHYLISLDLNDNDKVCEIIAQLRNMEGIEVESTLN